jgi:hypothetical protein
MTSIFWRISFLPCSLWTHEAIVFTLHTHLWHWYLCHHQSHFSSHLAQLSGAQRLRFHLSHLRHTTFCIHGWCCHWKLHSQPQVPILYSWALQTNHLVHCFSRGSLKSLFTTANICNYKEKMTKSVCSVFVSIFAPVSELYNHLKQQWLKLFWSNMLFPNSALWVKIKGWRVSPETWGI